MVILYVFIKLGYQFFVKFEIVFLILLKQSSN